MGKARIIEAHGEGQYTIEVIEARERAEAAKQQAQGRIDRNQTDIAELESRINTAQSAVDSAVAEQDAAIKLYQQQMRDEGASSIDLASYAQAILEAAAKRDSLAGERRVKQMMIASDQALVARVDALPPLRQMQAWCADYTEDLNGEIATAEVPGEIGSVIIKPGFEGANQWSAAADGAIQPALAGTPAGTFYNLAMMPGWQKWRPTFRTATITSLSGDTCSISLDSASSSQQGLGVNAQSSYSGVPILYMYCDGGAFEEGDKVLVAFAGNVSGPTVVGFESEPKMCGKNTLLIVPLNGSEVYYDAFSYHWPELHDADNPDSASDVYLADLQGVTSKLAAYDAAMGEFDFLIVRPEVAWKRRYGYIDSDGEFVMESRSALVHPVPDFATLRNTSRFSYQSMPPGYDTTLEDFYNTIDSGALIEFYEDMVNTHNDGLHYKKVIIIKLGVTKGDVPTFIAYADVPAEFISYLHDQDINSVRDLEFDESSFTIDGRWLWYVDDVLPSQST